MVKVDRFDSREAWLKGRKTIGGSDIAAVMGESPWMSNIDLWKLKTGRAEHKEIEDNDLVIYGQKAEELLRDLFALDFPQFEVSYFPENMWKNSGMPFAHSSLDGWIHDERNRLGVLEIKTATIQGGRQRKQWEDGKIPQHYYLQLLWEMAVTEAQFGVLLAQLKYERDGDVLKVTRHYFVERDQVEQDIEAVKQAGAEFWTYVTTDTEPPARLPEIF